MTCIRIDNGGDFLKRVGAYCRENLIRYQRSQRFNGVAERMNKVLVERVNCLLLDGGLPESFWGKALSIIVHVLNFSPCVSLQHEVPEMICSGKNVSYDHLCVFGCKTFVKSRQCVFLAYGLYGVGYRLYYPVLKKLIRCCEAEFIEDQRLKDIDRVIVDDPTRDEYRENCHGGEVQSEVEPVAQIKSTHVKKPLLRYTTEGVAIAIDDRAPGFDSQEMKNVDVYDIVVGKTTDCLT